MKTLTHRIAILTVVALVGLTPASSRAVDPITLVQVVGITTSYISSVTGILSLALNVAAFYGDYEEQTTVVRTKRFQDTVFHSYRGVQRWQERTSWLIGDSGPYFRTDEWTLYPDGQLIHTHDADPFPHALEQRTYSCTTAQGMNQSVQSSVAFQICYVIAKPSNLKYFIAPDPMNVTVRWNGTYLTESCLDGPKGGFSMARERTANRRVWADLPLPNSKSMEILSVTVVPHKA